MAHQGLFHPFDLVPNNRQGTALTFQNASEGIQSIRVNIRRFCTKCSVLILVEQGDHWGIRLPAVDRHIRRDRHASVVVVQSRVHVRCRISELRHHFFQDDCDQFSKANHRRDNRANGGGHFFRIVRFVRSLVGQVCPLHSSGRLAATPLRISPE